MQLSTVVATWQRVAQTTARSAKTEAIAALLVAAAPEEVGLLVKWLSGDLAQRQIGVGWAMLRDAPQPSAQPSLTVIDVDEAFTSIADDGGTGSQARRRAALASILTAATAEEQTFLRALLSGGLRQGALAGVMVEAVARAASVPSSEVRRAAMVSGDLAVVAAAALHEGVDALSGLQLTPLRPVHPMLAQTSPNVAEALRRLGGRAGLEWKVDGVRIQAHRRGSEIALFTRTLDDVTRRLPESVRTVGLLAVSSIVIDGEVIALDDSGRPRPFQVTAARTGRRGGTDTSTSSGSGSGTGIPLHAYWFDVLHLDGTDLLTAPAAARRQALGGR
jgi:DNA ligase-1